MNKLDIHTNLGTFPGSASAISNDHYCSVKELYDHIVAHNITHHVCLYGRDEYHLLQELADMLPNVKHYGLQCLFGLHQDAATDISNIPFDINRSDRPLCAGIKLHSVRGWWTGIKDETNEKGGSGIEYGQYNLMRKILNKLPKSTIVSMHTQGSLNHRNKGTPLHIAHLASKYPALKFIINHAGDYGVQSFKPSFMIKDKPGVNGGFADYMLLHSQSKGAIANSILYSQDFHNIFLDTSNYCTHKAEIFNKLKPIKWCIGTDIPFGNASVYNFTKEETRFANAGLVCDYDNAIHWVESATDVLILEHSEQNGLTAIKSGKKTVYRKAIPEEQRPGNPESTKDYSYMLPVTSPVDTISPEMNQSNILDELNVVDVIPKIAPFSVSVLKQRLSERFLEVNS
jgi:hypothetical protein